MFKKIVFSLLVVLGLAGFALAQSGRRGVIRTSSTPSAPTTINTTDPSVNEAIAKEEELGYSESAPSSARPLYPRSSSNAESRDKKPKKEEKKKDDKKSKEQPQNTTADTTAANVPPTPGETAAIDGDEVLKIDTNLITIPVAVFNRNGMYMSGLKQENFKIFEDGVEQEVAYFGTTDQPITVVLLIDVSPSTEFQIEEIQKAAISFIDQLKPQDKVIVIEFDENVRVLADLTNDRQKIYKGINKTGFGSGTSLYEAVEYSLLRKLNKIEGRKAIVLFTDGVDTTSNSASFESTIRDAEEADSVVFPIYYNTFLDNTGIGRGTVMSGNPSILGIPGGMGGMGGMNGNNAADYSRGRSYLQMLSETTGGRVYRAESTPGGLDAAFESIADELSRQYNIGYYSQNESKAGQRKQIKVRVDRPRLVIRTRDSYIVGDSQATKKTE